jgi:thiamine biosynthesis lipoprotein
MTLTRRTFLAATLASAALPARAGATQSLGGPAFGSYWRLTLPEGADPAPARAAIAAVVAKVDRLMSPYRGDSDLTRFNTRASTDLVPLAPETARVTRTALALTAETEGAFDPTVGPIVARYGFGPIAGGAGGAALLTLEGDGLRKARSDLTLDLCGIAKGHALDRAVAALDALGHTGFLLELGGEVFARGTHPEGRPWQIGVEGAEGGLARLSTLADTAVATSGDTVQGYALGRRRYGHIINPKTGAPASDSLASVTVFHASAARADALATALFAMGRERALAFAEAQDLDMLLLAREGTAIRALATGNAGRRLVGEDAT